MQSGVDCGVWVGIAGFLQKQGVFLSEKLPKFPSFEL
jgi:hypothetical protein